jgi:peptide/nickel transport system ATP-binding protein
LPTKHEHGAEPALVDVSGLHVGYALRRGPLARLTGGGEVIKAVDGVSFQLRRGEVLGLVGESGSGKSTLGRALLGLVPASSGSIRYAGTELVGRSERRMRPLRRRLQMVFQDPHASLNPAMDVGTAVGHPLRIHGMSGRHVRERVIQALELVGLSPAHRYLSLRPADLSGGQKQRVVIARATILGPELLVADEPVSMLDMSVRAKILALMLDLKQRLNLTYLYITHDLATAKLFCDRVAIMYLGRIVEIGSTEEVFADPKHPYTRALLAAVPDLRPEHAGPRDVPAGEIPDAARPPAGCSYHPRCPYAFAPCGFEGRDLRALLEARWIGAAGSVGVPGPAGSAGVPGTAGDIAGESGRFADLDDFLRPARPARPARPGPAGAERRPGAGASGSRVRIRPARGHTPVDVLETLATARTDAPDEPVWRGVRAMAVEDRAAVVEFEPPTDPGLRDTGAARVACHLFDPRFAPAEQVS